MMGTVDITKFKNHVSNKLNIPVGFADPKVWLDTGNYALNRLISGSYNRGVPLGKVTMFAGESGSGKSLLAANVIKAAQESGVFVLFLDTEGAGDEEWFKNAGIDTKNNFFRAGVFTVSDCTKVVSDFVKEVVNVNPEQNFLVIIDSLGMLETDSGQENFLKGETKGDQGQLAKQLKRFIKNCVFLCEQRNVGFLVTNHTYASQDMFNPDQKITGGDGIIYASSIVIATRKLKLKLKDGEVGDDIATSTGVHGIRSNVMVYKSRFNKPFERTTINIPWSIGIDKYSGLSELFENDGVIVKDGNKLRYRDKSSQDHKYYRKDITAKLLDLIMEENPYSITREAILEAAERDREIESNDSDDEAE